MNLPKFLLLLLLLTFPLKSQARPLKLRGYAETRYYFLLGRDLGEFCSQEKDLSEKFKLLCDPHLLYVRFRPSAKASFGRKAKLRITANLLTTHLGLAHKIEKIEDILTIPRLYLDLRTKYVDIRLGKQAFQWGPALLWSLTIPYNPQNPMDLNAEHPGLWGANFYYPYSETGGIRLAILADPEFKGVMEVLRWNHTIGTTELAFSLLHDDMKKRVSLGADIKGQWTIGFWLEAIAHFPYDSNSDADATFALVVGIDYSFPLLEGFYFALQYHYNHDGITDPQKYPFKTTSGLVNMAQSLQKQNSLNSSGSLSLMPAFLAAHYALFMGRLNATEELTLSLMLLANLIDPSFMSGLSLAYIAWEDFTFNLAAYFLFGPEGSEYNIGPIKGLPLPHLPKEGARLMPSTIFMASVRFNF